MPVREFNFIHSRSELSRRLSRHANGSIHILACEKLVKESDQNSKNDPGENEAINIEPTHEIKNKIENEQIMEPTGDEIKNKIDEKTRLKIPPGFLEYLETGVMKEHTWVQIIDGKLFCQVNLTSEI